MRIKVTEQGVTIPKSLLPNVDESPVRESRKGKGVLKDEPYPLSALGRNPIPEDELDIKDASVNHDKYIYAGNSPSPQPSPSKVEGE